MEPLHGIRIIDITTNASGPLATGILADQGADVIRVETVGLGDPSRYVGGTRGGFTGYNMQMNRNKRAVAMDLKDARVRPAMAALVKTADVFVQNSRPGALERAGYGFADLHKLNPRLIYVSISGFGPDGPAAAHRVYDPIIQAVSGFASAQGYGSGKPELVRTIASDKIAAYTAAQAISSALFARERGEISGHSIDISMLDASLAFLWADVFWNHSFVGTEGFQPKPLISEFYQLIPSADGYISSIVVGDAEFKGACRALGCDELLSDRRFNTLAERFANYGLMLAEFEKKSRSFTAEELIARLEKEDVPCAQVNTLDSVLTDPRVQHAGSLIEYDHPAAGRIRQARPAAIFDGVATGIRRPAPALGEHTDEVLAELGIPAAELASWREAGVIG
jgi:crotonobetainyl-CoA:carnitine CoA-transferase CaiB-like acyl-CoA transferase